MIFDLHAHYQGTWGPTWREVSSLGWCALWWVGSVLFIEKRVKIMNLFNNNKILSVVVVVFVLSMNWKWKEISDWCVRMKWIKKECSKWEKKIPWRNVSNRDYFTKTGEKKNGRTWWKRLLFHSSNKNSQHFLFSFCCRRWSTLVLTERARSTPSQRPYCCLWLMMVVYSIRRPSLWWIARRLSLGRYAPAFLLVFCWLFEFFPIVVHFELIDLLLESVLRWLVHRDPGSLYWWGVRLQRKASWDCKEIVFWFPSQGSCSCTYWCAVVEGRLGWEGWRHLCLWVLSWTNLQFKGFLDAILGQLPRLHRINGLFEAGWDRMWFGGIGDKIVQNHYRCDCQC